MVEACCACIVSEQGTCRVSGLARVGLCNVLGAASIAKKDRKEQQLVFEVLS